MYVERERERERERKKKLNSERGSVWKVSIKNATPLEAEFF